METQNYKKNLISVNPKDGYVIAFTRKEEALMIKNLEIFKNGPSEEIVKLLMEREDQLSVTNKILLGKINKGAKTNEEHRELVRISGAIDSMKTFMCDAPGAIKILQETDQNTLRYMRNEYEGEKEQYEEKGMVPVNPESFFQVFRRSEILSFVSQMPRANRVYFQKKTGIMPPPVMTYRPKTLLTAFNVEALAFLYFKSLSDSDEQVTYPCECVFHLHAMPCANLHHCKSCGGLSEIDETLSSQSIEVRKFLVLNKYVFLHNSSMLVKVGNDYYCDKIENVIELQDFIKGIVQGEREPTFPQIDAEQIMDEYNGNGKTVSLELEQTIMEKQIERVSREVTDVCISEVDMVPRIQSRQNVTVMRGKVEDGVLRELVMYDLDTQIYRRLNSTLDYADSFRNDRLYLDPHSYLYRHIVNYRPKMEIRVQESYPPQDTLIGISSWGKVFSGSPQDQLRQEVSRLTGMRVPSYPEISGIFVDGYAHPFHMFTNHKIVDLRDTVHVCLVCAETIDFKKVFADDGLLSNGQEFFSRVLCKACSSMAVHWEKKDLFQVVNFTGLRPLLLTTVKEENGLFQADYLPVETAYQQVYPRRTYRYKKDAMTEAYSIQLKKLVENMSNGIISPDRKSVV